MSVCKLLDCSKEIFVNIICNESWPVLHIILTNLHVPHLHITFFRNHSHTRRHCIHIFVYILR